MVGSKLSLQLLREYTNTKLTSSSSSCTSEAIRNHIQTYIDDFPQCNRRCDSTFPWAKYDENIEDVCEKLLDNDDIDSCRSYVLGYLECISNVPKTVISSQGLTCRESAGWVIRRHPFGQTFSIFMIALSILIDEQDNENLTRDFIINLVDEFVKLSTQAWSLWFVNSHTHSFIRSFSKIIQIKFLQLVKSHN